MRKRAYGLYFLLLALLAAAAAAAFRASGGSQYVTAIGAQSVYRLDVARARGTIYDCNMEPLVGSGFHWEAAVAPTIETIGRLEKATGGAQRQRLKAALESGKPFSMEVADYREEECVDVFRVPDRYDRDQLAPHVIGYVDGSGNGVSGVELAMDDLLGADGGEITVYYRVDALGRVIAGADRKIVNTVDRCSAGVQLTIDSRIQRAAERAAARLEKGAVVVTEVPGGEIRALVSMPDFSPLKLGEAAEDPGSPLLNRAFCAYSPGSVFKLVTAAQELETGGFEYPFTCTGSIAADGLLFQCIDGTAHGTLTLHSALRCSCNCYFVTAARALGPQSVLEMAYNLGFGGSQEFGRGLFSAPGDLPDLQELENPRALANFSFGQGSLTVTPLQVAGMMNCIASGGIYSTPRLIEAVVDSEKQAAPVRSVKEKQVRVMKTGTALQLQADLEGVARSGTGVPGAPSSCIAGIKTGTAQTGITEDGQELLHFWYTGFLSDESGPRYTVTVLRESTPDDGGAAAQTFRSLSEKIAELCFS